MGTIVNLTITAGQVAGLRLDGGSRCVIRVDGNDVRIGYREDSFTDEYFTIKDGEAFVFDPNPLTGNTLPELGAIFYAKVQSGADATIQVWYQSGGY